MSTEPTDGMDIGVGQADIGSMGGRGADQTTEENDTVTTQDSTTDTVQSWRQLLHVASAKSRKIRGSNYVQLATIDPALQEPRCRTVVFRGFLALPRENPCYCDCDGLACVMRMITDQRSQKVQQIQMADPPAAAAPTSSSSSSNNNNINKNNAELLWWFPKTSEQFRIRGRLVFVGGGTFPFDHDPTLRAARKEQWGNLSDSARESFYTEPTPGEAFVAETDTSMVLPPVAGRDSQGKILPPPDNFLLMLLVPTHCDYLRLTNMYRQIDERTEHHPDCGWTSRRVNP